MKVIADLPLGMFTAPGPQAVIAPVAERVFNCAQTLARDGSIGPKTGRTFVGYEQAPGLRCMITVVHFVDQGREGSLRPYIYLEWQQMPGYTEEGWSRFRQVPDGEWREKLAAYRTVNRITERVPMYIGLGAAAVHLPKQWKQALRRSEQWRFDPQKADPLASWMRNHLDPQIKADRAVLERRGNREPPTWGRMLYINPKKQTVNDAYFQLTLVLLQERILPETAALQAEMIVYLAQWADEATALMVFKALLRHFTEPDDWRTLMAYCKTVARREAQQEQPGRVIGGRQERREGGNTADGRYTVDEAVDWLQAHECLVHRATIYRWIHAGKITAIDENGGMWLSEDSLRQAREFVRLRQQRKAVRELAQIRGRTSEAARKFVRRRLQKGENLQDIASAIMCKMPDESKERADMGAG